MIKATKADQKRLQAQALFHLSQAYECMGQDAKVISSLTDVYNRKELLPDEVSRAEVPARLAVAYARIDNIKMAEKYFLVAEDGLKRISAKKISVAKKQEILSRALYQMGKIDIFKFDVKSSIKYLKSIEYIQKYLLKSAELDHKTWSPRSAEQLLKAYDRIWDFVETFEGKEKSSKSKLTEREVKIKKVELVQLSLININQLKDERFPSPNKIPIIETLFRKISDKEKRFQAYLAKNIVGNDLTKENEARFGTKRKGRLKKVKAKKAAPLPNKKTKGDPNL